MVIFAQPKIPNELIGEWKAVEKKDEGAGIEFKRGDTVVLFYHGEKKLITDLQLDSDKNPIWFDFTINEGPEKIPVKSLLLFLNKDLVKWQVFTQEPRQAHFTQSAGDIMYLRRYK